MACRFMRFPPASTPGDEWVPMGLQDAVCILRQSDPKRWAAELACHGIQVEEGDTLCMHNLTATWDECPLHVDRKPAKRPKSHGETNEFGYPLNL